jgi:hypothetical protein
VARLRKHLGDRSLLDDFTGIHHAHTIRDLGHDGEVVADQDQPHVASRLEGCKQVQYLCLDGHVERSGRLVCNQQPWRVRNRGRDHGALTLATRQLMRIGASTLPWVGQAHVRQQPDCACRCFGPRGLMMRADRFRHLVADPVHRIEAAARILEHHCDLVSA